jgi:hypothetical protein
MVCHLAGLGTVLVAALVWILVRGRSALADDQGKESVNFQLLIAVIFCALVLASYCIPFLPVIQPLVYLSYVALAGFDLTMIVLGAVRASDGERFRYRVSLRLMR